MRYEISLAPHVLKLMLDLMSLFPQVKIHRLSLDVSQLSCVEAIIGLWLSTQGGNGSMQAWCSYLLACTTPERFLQNRRYDSHDIALGIY